MTAAFKVRLQDGSEMGPLDLQMLRSWYQQGLVNRESKVRPGGSRQWIKLADAVDIGDWGAAGGTRGRGRRKEEDGAAGADDPQTWRTYTASALFFAIAAGAGYFALYPERWLPALAAAPWREIALGHVLLGLILVRGWTPMRKVARVLVFLLTFSLFGVAAPVLLQGFDWRAIAILVSAWVMGSGLFFFLAGRSLPWTSVALSLVWVAAGAAGVGLLGFVPPRGASAASVEVTPAPAEAAPAVLSPSAAVLARELPLLSPRAAEVVVARGIGAPEEAFKRSYLLAASGVSALSPPEARELGEITTAAYAPLPPPQRRRLDAYMERIRGLQVTLPQEDREMSALVRESVLQLPEPQRVRFQALYEKALVSAR
ncbi:MAG TPA: hypothetical protein VMR21_11715 [Vicinamibacteria bacterium]|nr:hypothetical protein [Vicinamibacteria bacterium]